jgi:hypothetical protein
MVASNAPPAKLEQMMNIAPGPGGDSATNERAPYSWARGLWRRLVLDPSSGVFALPLLYIPAALYGNRMLLAVIAGAWVIAQVANGVGLIVPDPYFPGQTEGYPRGAAVRPAILAQLVGLAPWLLVPFAWSSLSTAALLVALPLAAAWGTAWLTISGGEGPGLLTRCRASLYREMAVVVAGLFGFAAFILLVIFAIKALHPLA